MCRNAEGFINERRPSQARGDDRGADLLEDLALVEGSSLGILTLPLPVLSHLLLALFGLGVQLLPTKHKNVTKINLNNAYS